MIITEWQILNEIDECNKQVKIKPRNCYVQDCDVDAINSHVLWKKGILKPISVNSELTSISHSQRLRYGKMEFKNISINKILSFKGFCNPHDSKIFENIEQHNTDYTNTKNQMLLSVRSLYHERRKKEIAIEQWKCIIDKKAIVEPEKVNFILNHVKHEILNIRDIAYYSTELNKDIYNPKGRFIFRHFEIDQNIPIVCSTNFNCESLNELTYEANSNPNWESNLLNLILFSFFPVKNKSYMIIGFHSDFFSNIQITKKINNYSEKQKLKLLSDILIQRIESWACSPNFYINHIKPKEKAILSEFDNEPSSFNGSLSNIINIFEEW